MFTKKKILAFVMLLAVAAPLFFFTGFWIKQKLIEHEMEERLETACLQTVTVKITGIQWLKENKEAVIDDKLFDVRYYTTKGNTIILTGLYDKDEDHLHEQLKNFMQQKNGASSPMSNVVVKFLFPPLYNNPASLVCQNNWKHLERHFFPYYKEKIPEHHLTVITHPPKYA
ncbi:hypothetical protein [Ferruginibacter sp. SUN106]|uniref:hypothetical protein n=1 Tax=Ferruginibacter sp. SUN106 TaxID=2978348 RepID=UPI003D36C5A8